MKRRTTWLMTILLPVMTACGDEQPQVMGTAHVLRVLESIESQQEAMVDRLTALEESVRALEASGRTDAASSSGGPMNADLATELTVATTVAFTEGPTAAEDGTLYFTDLGNNGIMRLSTDGQLSTFRQPSNDANGLIFDSEWRLLACEGGDGETGLPRVTRTDMETGEIEVLADAFEGRQLHRPNDLTIDGQGRVYFTDRARPEPAAGPDRGARRLPRGPGRDDRAHPDRAGGPASQRHRHLARRHDAVRHRDRSGRGRTADDRAYDLSPEGTAGNMRVFHDFYPGRSGDGMTIDTQGNLYVAAGLNSLRGSSETLDTVAGVHVFSPAGELLRHIPIPEDAITNAAFGGPDLRTLYVTAGKTVFSLRTEIEGTRR